MSSTLTSENLKVMNKIKSGSQIFQTKQKLVQEFRIFCLIKIICNFEEYVISGLCSSGFSTPLLKASSTTTATNFAGYSGKFLYKVTNPLPLIICCTEITLRDIYIYF